MHHSPEPYPMEDWTAETIDMTPTFEQAVKMCIFTLRNGTPEGIQMATEELLRYGRELDRLKTEATKGK